LLKTNPYGAVIANNYSRAQLSPFCQEFPECALALGTLWSRAGIHADRGICGEEWVQSLPHFRISAIATASGVDDRLVGTQMPSDAKMFVLGNLSSFEAGQFDMFGTL
jgi:hypothetical protein